MKIKSKALIFGAIFALLALTTIQAYLIFNTYNLKKRAFASEARSIVGRIYSTKHVDSLSWIYRTKFIDRLPDYENGLITREKLLEELEKDAAIVNKDFLEYYNRLIAQSPLETEVFFKITASSISITTNDGHTESLLDNHSPIFLLGENFPEKEGLQINTLNWTFDKEYTDNNNNPAIINVDYKAGIYMSILNFDRIIFIRLLFLFLIASIMIIFIIALVTYSIHNLIKQKRLSEVKTDFINNITHELKTPLTTLSIASSTLANKYVQNNREIAEDSIHTINRQNQRLKNLIDQVANNSLGYHDIKLNLEPVNLSDFLNKLLDDFCLTLESQIEVTKNIEASDHNVLIDPFFFGTAIINILNNAVKYGGTIINFKYYIDKQNNVIAISDNGIGISQEHKKLIFEKFYRVSEKDTHNFKGLGLGLYYCNEVMKAHHGEIEIKSKKKIGSTFYLKIPLSNEKESTTS